MNLFFNTTLIYSYATASLSRKAELNEVNEFVVDLRSSQPWKANEC